MLYFGHTGRDDVNSFIAKANKNLLRRCIIVHEGGGDYPLLSAAGFLKCPFHWKREIHFETLFFAQKMVKNSVSREMAHAWVCVWE